MKNENLISNNYANIIGEICSKFTFSYEEHGEKFYMVHLQTKRLSSQVDVIPLMVSNLLIDVTRNYEGCIVEATGQFRSYNKEDGMRTRLMLFVFIQKINFIDDLNNCVENNQIYLAGYICKEPIYRITPLGREISDFLLAVNRSYGKSDYIPCIAWRNNARYIANLSVGSRVCVWGRIQSREYIKKISDHECETRVAYEVSASKINENALM